MQLSLYRAERPETFDDIIGQQHIVRILKNQLAKGTVSQAYLFAGTHGTGKTSTARILAKAVNCESEGDVPCGKCENCEAIREGRFVDVIELDAASNNKVDDLRAITELVKYPPTIGKYKVYIIDEVHMLTTAAENAFLKTLEEPPEYVIFILATTDPQKVKATIRSRCMQLNFRRVSESELIDGMRRICEKKNIDAAEDALAVIAARANGSVRDALSLLEQCIAAGDTYIDKEIVYEYTASAGDDFYIALTESVMSGDLGKAIVYIDEILRRGKDAKEILRGWLEHFRNLMVVKYVSKPDKIIASSEENIERLKKQSAGITDAEQGRAVRLLSEYVDLARYSDQTRILLETAAVRLAGKIDEAPMSTTVSAPAIRTKPAAKRPAPSPSPSPVTASAPACEPVSDEPIRISEPGDPEMMWRQISAEISRHDKSFGVLVGRHSAGRKYSDGELTVIVKANKLTLAEGKRDLIARTAEQIYGVNTRVRLRPGEPAAAFEEESESESKASAERGPDNGAGNGAEEIAGAAKEFFGLDVRIVE